MMQPFLSAILTAVPLALISLLCWRAAEHSRLDARLRLLATAPLMLSLLIIIAPLSDLFAVHLPDLGLATGLGSILAAWLGLLVAWAIRPQTTAEAPQDDELERLRIFASAGFEGLVIHADGKFVDCNRSFEGICGYHRNELIGQSIMMVVAPESQATVEDHVRRGDESPYEIKIVRADKTLVPVDLLGRQTRFRGRPARVVAVRDASGRKLAEERLYRSLAETRAVLGALPDTYLRVEGDGTIVEAHLPPDRQRLMATAPKTLTAYLGDAGAASIREAISRVLLSQELETLTIVSDSSPKSTATEARLIATPDQQVLIFLRDISERHRFEQRLSVLAEGLSSKTGDDYFRSLARYLGETLGKEIVTISRLDPSNRETLTTAAYWHDGSLRDPITYPVAATPCGDLLDHNVCIHEAHVADRYPDDTMLRDEQIESYIGVVLNDKSGTPIGNIAALSRQPLGSDHESEESIIRIFAARTEAELDRQAALQHLVAERTRYFDLLGTLPDGLVVCSNRIIEYVNPRLVELLGYDSASALIGRPYVDLLLPEDRHLAVANFEQAVASGELVGPVQRRYVRADNTLFTAEISGRAIMLGDEQRVQIAVRDVTERIEHDRRVGELEQELAALAAGSLDSVFIVARATDVDAEFPRFTVCHHNEQAGRQFTNSGEPLIGADFLTLFAIDLGERLAAELTAATLSYDTREHEWEVIQDSGPSRWLRIQIVPVGERLAVTVRDISERRQATAALAASDARYSRVTELVPGVIFEMKITDRANIQLTYVSPGIATIFGISANDAVANSSLVFDRIVPEDRGRLVQTLRTAARKGQPWRADFRVQAAAGVRWVRLEASPLSGQTALGYAGLVTDITERKRFEADLSASEARYRLLAERSTDVISVIGSDFTSRYVSPSIERQLGYAPSEIESMLPQDILHPDDQERITNELTEAMTGGRNDVLTTSRVRHRDGHYVWIESRTRIIRDADGIPEELQTTSRDISDRIGIERALRDSEAQFRALMRYSPVILAIKSIDGRYLMVSDSAVGLTPHAVDDVIGKRDEDLLPPELCEEIARLERQVIEMQTAIYYTVRFPSLQGVKYFDTIRFPMMNEDGEPFATATLALDVTAARASEATIRQSNQELATLSTAIMQTSSRVAITDNKGYPQFLNHAYHHDTNVDDDPPAKSPLHYFSADFLTTADGQRMQSLLDAGESWTARLRREDKSNHAVWERVSVSPIRDDRGEVTNYLVVCDDISREVEAQEQLQEADKLAAVGMLAAGVAHEFKNYLGGIIGHASLALEEMQSDESSTPWRDVLEQIITISERANGVAMGLLTYSRGRTDMIEVVDLPQVVTKTVTLIEREIRHRSIEVVTYVDPTLPQLTASAARIQQILLNLLINAVQSIDEPWGVVTIALLSDDDRVVIRVGDTGCGINRDVLPRIFDPFYSTKGVWGETESGPTGTGMGLSVARNLAREMGGDLTVETRAGIGSTFTLTLPLAIGVAGAEPLTPTESRRLLLFSMDRALITEMLAQAMAEQCELKPVDANLSVDIDLREAADAMIIDAAYSAKVELYRMLERCQRDDIPIYLINCSDYDRELLQVRGQTTNADVGVPALTAIIDGIRPVSVPSPT